jgi:hypothetical protein
MNKKRLKKYQNFKIKNNLPLISQIRKKLILYNITLDIVKLNNQCTIQCLLNLFLWKMLENNLLNKLMTLFLNYYFVE